MQVSPGTSALESGTHDFEGGDRGVRRAPQALAHGPGGNRKRPGQRSAPRAERGVDPFLTLAGVERRVCHFPLRQIDGEGMCWAEGDI